MTILRKDPALASAVLLASVVSGAALIGLLAGIITGDTGMAAISGSSLVMSGIIWLYVWTVVSRLRRTQDTAERDEGD